MPTPSSLFARLALLFGLCCLFGSAAGAGEPIRPLPQRPEYDAPLAELGMRLFFDPILSRDRTLSCASCHDPEHGGADPRRVSVGVDGQLGSVNAPPVFNAVFNFRQFWNGRAADLVEQAAGPIHNPIEMALAEGEAARRLNADPDYRRRFREVLGVSRIGLAEVTRAIAEFERALITPGAKFDRYLRGELELNPSEAEGYRLFKSLGCIACHNGINVGGNSYQYLGVVNPYPGDRAAADRFQVTGDEFDRNRFKVPSLRNVALTAPYFHDGSRTTLREAIQAMAVHNLGFVLSGEEQTRLESFLHTLTGRRPAILEAAP